MSSLAQDRLDASLRRYADWLNSMRTAIDDFTVTPEQFLPAHNEHASEPYRVASYRADDYDVRVWRLYDGDDGGPAWITVYFYENEDTPWHATQNFDTYLTVWLKDGELTKEGQS